MVRRCSGVVSMEASAREARIKGTTWSRDGHCPLERKGEVASSVVARAASVSQRTNQSREPELRKAAVSEPKEHLIESRLDYVEFWL